MSVHRKCPCRHAEVRPTLCRSAAACPQCTAVAPAVRGARRRLQRRVRSLRCQCGCHPATSRRSQLIAHTSLPESEWSSYTTNPGPAAAASRRFKSAGQGCDCPPKGQRDADRTRSDRQGQGIPSGKRNTIAARLVSMLCCSTRSVASLGKCGHQCRSMFGGFDFREWVLDTGLSNL